MNKTLLFSIIGVVVIVGVGAYLMMGSRAGGLGGAISGNQEGSLKELLSSQNPQKCTFDSQAGMASSSGEVYVVGGKMRGDFVSLASGQTVKSHMIVSNGTSYVWTDMMNQGFKMSLDAVTQNQAGQKQGVDINQKVKYSCSDWSEDGNAFSLPQGVTFSDLSSMMQRVVPGATVNTSGGAKVGTSANGLQGQCGTCDLVPDAAAKAQCKAALGCK